MLKNMCFHRQNNLMKKKGIITAAGLMLMSALTLAGCGTNGSSADTSTKVTVDNGTPAEKYRVETSEGTVNAYPGSSKYATIKMGVYEDGKQTELCKVKVAYDYYMSSTGMNNTGKNTQMEETAGRTVEDIVKNNVLGKAEVYPATINLASAGQNENNLTFTIMKHDDLNVQGVKDMYPEGKDVSTESGLSGYLRYSKDNKSAVLVVELNDKWTLGIQNSGKNVSEMSIDNLANALAELIRK